MRSFAFHIEIEPDAFPDGTPAFHASCPALSGCHSWGRTAEEALANIREAVEIYVDDLAASGDPIPTDVHLGVIEIPSPSVVVNV